MKIDKDVKVLDADKKGFKLYKIYSENCLLYLGRTKQPLKTRLHQHFFKAPMVREINIDAVTKIECALFPTEADMNVMEVYLINKLKPVLNRDDKAKDELTFELPSVQFFEYECHLMQKWSDEIHLADAADKGKRERNRKLELEKSEKRKEIFNRDDISLNEKQELWWAWLEEFYEPVRNSLL